VVIDFTSPEASAEHAAICARLDVPLVVGSTRLHRRGRAAVAEASKRIPIVIAPNMSIGVNLMFRLAREAARTLGDAYDPRSWRPTTSTRRTPPAAPPSASRRWWRRGSPAISPRPLPLPQGHDRRAAPAPDRGPDAARRRRGRRAHRLLLRRGGAAGDHPPGHLPDQFARGAVRAASWVVGKPAGLYDMQDVLGFR